MRKAFVYFNLFIFYFLLLPLAGAQDLSTDIYYGDVAELSGSPIAYLTIVSKNNQIFSCTGTAITKKKILTAAHCLADGVSSITAVFEGTTSIEAKSFVIHRNYRPLSSESDVTRNDLAIIKLKSRIPDSVVPLKISKRAPRSGQEILIYGYGFDEFGDIGVLKFSNMSVVSKDRFNLAALGGGNTCNGDSGGPALYQYRSNGRIKTEIVGVTSFGSADCSLLDTTFAYTLSKSAKSFLRKKGK